MKVKWTNSTELLIEDGEGTYSQLILRQVGWMGSWGCFYALTEPSLTGRLALSPVYIQVGINPRR